MVVGVLTLQLSIPANHDLKGKRRVLQSLIAKLRESFNVAVAEVADQDKWQVATLGIVSVSSDASYVHGLLTKVVESAEQARLDANVLDYVRADNGSLAYFRQRIVAILSCGTDSASLA